MTSANHVGSRGRGLQVESVSGAPGLELQRAIEIDVGCNLPVAFDGMRRLLRALEPLAPEAVSAARANGGAEWNQLFPEAKVDAPDLYELADAPNQRRLFRESEQVYRTLNVAARMLVDGLRALERPLVLRNSGSCDLVSLRGLMHAVELSRLHGVEGRLLLCDSTATHRHPSRTFADARAGQIKRALARMGASSEATASGDARPRGSTEPSTGLEGRYLSHAIDAAGSLEHRLAAALLAIRACFFSTNHEGATLAIEAGLGLLERTQHIDEGLLARAWDEQDDRQFDIPMLELDRSHLGDRDHLRALFNLHLGVVCAFTGRMQAALDAFAAGLACNPKSPECVADLHLYRAAALTKRMGRISEARSEIEAGLRALAPLPNSRAALHQAWLHNLSALTCVQERNIEAARREEELSLACIDQIPGPSATHLKTNLISNFSVLAEAEGDFTRAIRIWKLFAPLNEKLGSASANKVHAFRLGTLLYRKGDERAALDSLEIAFEQAESTGDIFNGETIAASLARIHLARGQPGRDEARAWYSRAAERARQAGDSLHLAQDLAGLSLATGNCGFAGAREALACNSTYRLAGIPFVEALATGAPQAIADSLPLPKSKMTRPFDLVNL